MTAQGVGLDTSVVLRILTGTPEEQYTRALAFLRQAREERTPVFVSDLAAR